MKFFEKDKHFTILAFVLFVMIVLDMYLTREGLKKGFEEFNPILLFLFNIIGIQWTLICGCLIGMFAFISFIYIRNLLKKEKDVRMLYLITSLLISWKAFIVGSWIGLLSYNI